MATSEPTMCQGVATKRSTCDNAQRSQKFSVFKNREEFSSDPYSRFLRFPMPLDLPAFRPHPLVRGGHLQTLVGTYLPNRVAIDSNLHRVPLPDGDALALHDDGPSGAGFPPAADSRSPTPLP